MFVLQVSEKTSPQSLIHPAKWVEMVKVHRPGWEQDWVAWGKFGRKRSPNLVIIHALNQRPHFARKYKSQFPGATIVGLSYNELWFTGAEKDSTIKGKDKTVSAFEMCHLAMGRVSPGVELPSTINWFGIEPMVDTSVFKLNEGAPKVLDVFQARGWSNRPVYWHKERTEALTRLNDCSWMGTDGTSSPKEMNALMSGSKVVLALRNDSGPAYTALEAIMSGAIPVVSDCEAYRGVFQKEIGVRLAKRDPADIERCVREIMALSPEEYEEENAHARAICNKFTLDYEGARIVAALERQLGLG